MTALVLLCVECHEYPAAPLICEPCGAEADLWHTFNVGNTDDDSMAAWNRRSWIDLIFGRTYPHGPDVCPVCKIKNLDQGDDVVGYVYFCSKCGACY